MKKRYGVGSLEEEIRRVRDKVAAGCDFSTEELTEAKNTVNIKRDKHNMMGTTATVKMNINRGKMTFDLKYADGRSENGINAKQMAAKML